MEYLFFTETLPNGYLPRQERLHHHLLKNNLTLIIPFKLHHQYQITREKHNDKTPFSPTTKITESSFNRYLHDRKILRVNSRGYPHYHRNCIVINHYHFRNKHDADQLLMSSSILQSPPQRRSGGIFGELIYKDYYISILLSTCRQYQMGILFK